MKTSILFLILLVSCATPLAQGAFIGAPAFADFRSLPSKLVTGTGCFTVLLLPWGDLNPLRTAFERAAAKLPLDASGLSDVEIVYDATLLPPLFAHICMTVTGMPALRTRATSNGQTAPN